MTLLVIGKNGQLAQALMAASGKVTALGRAEINLHDAADIERRIEALRPTAIINTAAYTAVDAAEADEAAAFALNGAVPGMLATAATHAGIPLLHVSTDYVFSGPADRPWREDDPIRPQSVYGRSKAAGEMAVLEAGGIGMVVRTAWLYRDTGRNFLTTMLRLGRERSSLFVVDDQIGAPTYVDDLADALIRIAAAGPQTGLFHLTNGGQTSWHGFAEAIFALAKTRGMPVPDTIEKTTTAAFGAPAPRPCWSVLDCKKITDAYGIVMPDWRSSLVACMGRVKMN